MSGAAFEYTLAVLAREVAEEAGVLIKNAFGTGFRVEQKSSPADLVTEVDRAAEQFIASRLEAAVPGSTVLGEEFGSHGEMGAVRWHIDPIDGTQNFVIGRAYFSVSIGVEVAGRLVGGVVHDPIHEISYWATKDRAWQNDEPLPNVAEYGGHLGVNTGQPFQGLIPAAVDLPALLALLSSFGIVRNPGSIALQIAEVAAGRSSAALELMGAAPWDIAGGFAVAQAVGCTIVPLTSASAAYGTWGSPSFLVSRDARTAETAVPQLRGILERGRVPEHLAATLKTISA